MAERAPVLGCLRAGKGKEDRGCSLRERMPRADGVLARGNRKEKPKQRARGSVDALVLIARM
jgi:hypothetical protein